MGLPKWLSFDFFKSEGEKQAKEEAKEAKRLAEQLRVENEQLKQEILNKEANNGKVEAPIATVATVSNKQFLSLHYDGNKLTVVSLDGQLYVKTDATKDDIKTVREANTPEEVREVFYSTEIVEKKEIEQNKNIDQIRVIEQNKEAVQVKNGFPLLSETGEFDVDGNVVYFKGIKRSLPKLLVAKFSKIVARVQKEQAANLQNPEDEVKLSDEEFNGALNEDLEFLAHKRFTYWCFLAPYPQVLDKLYPFLEKHGLKLTKEGFFLAIRNVYVVEGTKVDYADVVTNAFTKIKTVWKKKPSNFEIWKKADDYVLYDLKKPSASKIENATLVGNVQELNDNISEDTTVKFTDGHTRTFDIRLNKWVKVDPTKIVWASEDCVGTGGLHFSLDSTGLVGDKSLLIAINPMHITSIGSYKGTSWAYFPFLATELKEARKMLLDQNFESFNLDFSKFSEEFESLEEAAKEGFKEHNKVEQFDLPTEQLPANVLNKEEITLVTKSLEEMKNELSKRVVEV